ncbi:MAG: hypothetical protein FJ100_05985 [Deltaproteobacteria bacterium]|nr:hypothetical protein [Deltaproteobacteria bacterium]
MRTSFARPLVSCLAAAFVLVAACRGAPSKPAVRRVEPVRDPRWADPEPPTDPSPVAAPSEVSVVLAGPPTATDPPESLTAVGASLETRKVEALGLAIDMPGPATAVAAGAGLGETWVFERPIRGSAYGLVVAVSRRPVANPAQLALAATEIGSKELAATGAEGDLWWVVKPVEGPVQQVWAARRAGLWALLAICTAPPDYLDLAVSACKTVRVDSPAP